MQNLPEDEHILSAPSNDAEIILTTSGNNWLPRHLPSSVRIT